MSLTIVSIAKGWVHEKYIAGLIGEYPDGAMGPSYP